jgi:hypothetical protein
MKNNKRRLGKFIQHPNTEFRFPCGHKGILPDFGCGNDFARWHKVSKPRGGYWCCQACSDNYYRGVGPEGLLTWAKMIIHGGKRQARLGGYKPLKITPEELISLRVKAKFCSDGCGEELKWCTDGRFKNPHLHHDHMTGEVYGFVTKKCNSAQGLFSKIGDGNLNAQLNWLKFHFPDIVQRIS